MDENKEESDALYDEIDQLVLQHALGVEIGDEERDVVALKKSKSSLNTAISIILVIHTFTGFLLSTIKLSARCIMKRVNL